MHVRTIRDVPVWIDTQGNSIDHNRLADTLEDALWKLPKAYLSWMKGYKTEIVISDKLEVMARAAPASNAILLSEGLLKNYMRMVPATLYEEVTHMIDNHLRTTYQPEFVAASGQDAEKLMTKTALALSRIWHRFEKAMPTGPHYSKAQRTEREMLPELLFCKEMLEQMYGLPLAEERVEAFYARFPDYLQFPAAKGKLQTNDAEKIIDQNRDRANVLSRQLILHVFGLIEIPKEQREAAVKNVMAHQKKQLEKAIDNARIIYRNPDNLTAEAMLRRIAPHLYGHVQEFEEKIKTIARFFDAYPKWQEMLRAEDAEPIARILKKGISRDMLMLMQQEEMSEAVHHLLEPLHLLLTNQKTLPAGHRFPEALIDGETPLAIAVAAENFELAGLIKKAMEEKGRERQ